MGHMPVGREKQILRLPPPNSAPKSTNRFLGIPELRLGPRALRMTGRSQPLDNLEVGWVYLLII